MNRIATLTFFLLLGILFSLLFSSGQIENPDTHLRLTQSRIYLEEGRLDLPNDVGEEMHGNVATIGGRRCMVYNPGQSLIFLPIYSLASFFFSNESDVYYLAAFLVSFLNMIVHSLCGYLLYRICLSLGCDKKRAYLVSLVFCFTSYSLLAAQSTYEHHFEMFFVLLCFLLSSSKQLKYSALYAGFAISIGLIFRSTTLFVVPAILLLLKKEDIIKFFIGLVLGIGIVLTYNFLRFYSLFENGYDNAWSIANGQDVEFWSIFRAPLNFYGLLFSPVKGLLIFSPTIFLGIFYFRKFFKSHKRESYAAVVLVLTYLVIFSMNFAWHGSIWSFGPRYILPIVPFLYLPLIHLKFNKWFLGFFVVVFLGQILLMSVNYKRALLSSYVQNGSINEVEYVYDWNNMPYVSQYRQLECILPANFNGKLYDFFPHEPWKKEVRLGSNESLLQNSLEKTSVNFWWVRMFHERSSSLEKGLALFILFSVLVGVYFLTMKIRRNE
jgi:hypothetical protein